MIDSEESKNLDSNEPVVDGPPPISGHAAAAGEEGLPNEAGSGSTVRPVLPKVSWLRRHAWAGVALLGLAFLFPLWTGREIVYSKHSDVVAQFLSMKAVGRRAVLDEGRFPLWNPSMNAGAPAFGNPETAYLYPIDWLFFLLPYDLATNLSFLLHVLVAGLAMYAFCRLFFERRDTAFFCAVAYMLSYRYLCVIYTGWLPKMAMYSLVPLLLWAVERVIRCPGPRRVAILAAVGWLSLIQGDMQQLYYAGLGAALFCSVRLFRGARGERGAVVKAILIAATLAVLLASPALLPRLEYAALSTRTTKDYGFFLGPTPSFAQLTTLIDPDDQAGARHEFWERNFYFGLGLAGLWIFAVWSRSRRALLLLLASALLVLLCFDTPLLRGLFALFPGFDLFRLSSRLLFLAQFVVTLLAGVGLEAFLVGATRQARVRFAGSQLLVALGCIAFGLAWGGWPLWVLGAQLLVVGLVVLARKPWVTFLLLLLIPIVDTGLRMVPLLSTRSLAEALPTGPVVEALHRRASEGRVLVVGRTPLPYGTAGYYGVDLVNGYGGLTLKHFIEYFSVVTTGRPNAAPAQPVIWTDCVQISRPDLLRALDVRHVVAHEDLSLEEAGFARVAVHARVPVFVFYEGVREVPVRVWAATSPSRSAFFAKAAYPVQTETDSLRALASPGSSEFAVVFDLDRPLADFQHNGGEARMTSRGINVYEYQLESRGQNFLVLSQIWYPGWRLYLDGKRVSGYRTNHALLGCSIPPGKHELRIEMGSSGLNWGVLLALSAAGAWLLLLLSKSRRIGTSA